MERQARKEKEEELAELVTDEDYFERRFTMQPWLWCRWKWSWRWSTSSKQNNKRKKGITRSSNNASKQKICKPWIQFCPDSSNYSTWNSEKRSLEAPRPWKNKRNVRQVSNSPKDSQWSISQGENNRPRTTQLLQKHDPKESGLLAASDLESQLNNFKKLSLKNNRFQRC